MKMIIRILVCMLVMTGGTRTVMAQCGYIRTQASFAYSPSVEVGPLDQTQTPFMLGAWSPEIRSDLGFNSACAPFRGYSSWTTSVDPFVGITITDGALTYNVYPTEYENIGFILQAYDNNKAPQPVIDNPTEALYVTAPNPITSASLGVKNLLRFVATAPLAPGVYVLSPRIVGKNWLSTDRLINDRNLSMDILFTGGTITVKGKTCTINAGDESKEVTLKPAPIGSFQGIGSTSGQDSFTMGLQCDAGVALYATMSDVSSPDNTSDVLSTTDASTATGVGLRLWANGSGTPVSFGPASSVKGNLNQWFIGGSAAAGATSYNIPFIVRYVKTSNDMTAGSVHAVSTITFSYQ